MIRKKHLLQEVEINNTNALIMEFMEIGYSKNEAINAANNVEKYDNIN